MILHFDITKIPRTTTRKEWEEMWRWKRETEQVLKKSLEDRLAMLRVYGTDAMIHDLYDEIINPPLLLGPHQ